MSDVPGAPASVPSVAENRLVSSTQGHDSGGLLYIDENAEVYEGHDALPLLEMKNDLSLVDSTDGVSRVPLDRWEEAQRYERRTWLEKNRSAIDDRNWYHSERFANYAPIRGMHFDRAIELGCGPFTNLRILLHHVTARHVCLLDPLIDAYLTHPHCYYRGHRLGGVANPSCLRKTDVVGHPVSFARHLRDAWKVGGVSGQPVHLIRSTIEDYVVEHSFDLVVMVNVLEHCRDARAVFQRVVEMVEPGGMLVFHDVLYAAAQLEQLAAALYDAGHPLRVGSEIVDSFLRQHFDTLMRGEYLVKHQFRGMNTNRHELYFVGRRK